MSPRPLIFHLVLILSLAAVGLSPAAERWEAEIVLRFRGPGELSPGSEGLLDLRIDNGRVRGIFRSSAGISRSEVAVRGQISGRIDPSAARQRLSMKLRSLKEEAGEIDLEGVLTHSGNRLHFQSRRVVWIQPRSGVASPDHFVARLHIAQDSFDLLEPFPNETIEKFLERVEREFQNGTRSTVPVIPYIRKVLIPTDENGFWSMPLIYHAKSGGIFRSRSLTVSEAGDPFSRGGNARSTPPPP